ncbi:MAG: hypothetical protein ABF807_11625, partial [Liquorilactobacillus nagelii]|uniref:hypothetical protein n=1 Tax=Liquorilactobacillus nagelii TaxID=82688 RepID=UPI0039E9DFD4
YSLYALLKVVSGISLHPLLLEAIFDDCTAAAFSELTLLVCPVLKLPINISKSASATDKTLETIL